MKSLVHCISSASPSCLIGFNNNVSLESTFNFPNILQTIHPPLLSRSLHIWSREPTIFHKIMDPWGNESNCQHSGIPRRVQFLSRPDREGYHYHAHNFIWEDFPASTVGLFQASFQRKMTSRLPQIIVEIDGAISLVDFTNMQIYDTRNGSSRSIAWKDDHERWYMPRNLKEGSMCNGGTKGIVTGPSFHVIYRPGERDIGPFYPPILPDLNQIPPAWWHESSNIRQR